MLSILQITALEMFISALKPNFASDLLKSEIREPALNGSEICSIIEHQEAQSRCVRNQNAHIWSEEVLDSIHRTFKSQSSNQEDGENNVGQSGCDVNSLEETRIRIE